MSTAPQRFQRLLQPVHAAALSFARCLSRSRADGDDLFQEALLRALCKLDSLRDEAAFKGWLYRVIITVHRNRCRREFWRRLIPLAGHEPEPRSLDPSEALSGAERARYALSKLPTDQREAIVLFEIEGWQIEEIAALHGVSVSAIKSRLSRGRCRLRGAYTALGERTHLSTTPILDGDPP